MTEFDNLIKRYRRAEKNKSWNLEHLIEEITEYPKSIDEIKRVMRWMEPDFYIFDVAKHGDHEDYNYYGTHYHIEHNAFWLNQHDIITLIKDVLGEDANYSLGGYGHPHFFDDYDKLEEIADKLSELFKPKSEFMKRTKKHK